MTKNSKKNVLCKILAKKGFKKVKENKNDYKEKKKQSESQSKLAELAIEGFNFIFPFFFLPRSCDHVCW